jgi:hypothetical protein
MWMLLQNQSIPIQEANEFLQYSYQSVSIIDVNGLRLGKKNSAQWQNVCWLGSELNHAVKPETILGILGFGLN